MMALLRRFVAFIFVAILLAGCGMSNDEIGGTVKSSMQQTFDSDEQFKGLHLSVARVLVVKQGNGSYQGVATVIHEGSTHNVPVEITADGSNVLWQVRPGGFAFIAQKQLEKLQSESAPVETSFSSPQATSSAFPGQRKEVERVQSRDEYTKSFNGGFAYILEERYAVSDEVVQINLSTGAKRDVIDGNFVQVVRAGKYSGWILTARHRYYPQGGSYECVFIVRPDGKESFQINSERAKSDSGISSLVATLDSEDVECGGVKQASGK